MGWDELAELRDAGVEIASHGVTHAPLDQLGEPELAADLVENGIHLAGGGALLRGLEKKLAELTGLPVKVVDDPLCCVARGTSVYLENLTTWKETLESDADEY